MATYGHVDPDVENDLPPEKIRNEKCKSSESRCVEDFSQEEKRVEEKRNKETGRGQYHLPSPHTCSRKPEKHGNKKRTKHPQRSKYNHAGSSSNRLSLYKENSDVTICSSRNVIKFIGSLDQRLIRRILGIFQNILTCEHRALEKCTTRTRVNIYEARINIKHRMLFGNYGSKKYHLCKVVLDHSRLKREVKAACNEMHEFGNHSTCCHDIIILIENLIAKPCVPKHNPNISLKLPTVKLPNTQIDSKMAAEVLQTTENEDEYCFQVRAAVGDSFMDDGYIPEDNTEKKPNPSLRRCLQVEDTEDSSVESSQYACAIIPPFHMLSESECHIAPKVSFQQKAVSVPKVIIDSVLDYHKRKLQSNIELANATTDLESELENDLRKCKRQLKSQRKTIIKKQSEVDQLQKDRDEEKEHYLSLNTNIESLRNKEAALQRDVASIDKELNATKDKLSAIWLN